MRMTVSSDIRLLDLLYEMGVCAESVLLTINKCLVPETAVARKGDDLEMIYYKHVPPSYAQKQPGHWGKAGHSRCRCGSEPVAYIPAFGDHLCKDHFLESLEKRVKRTVREKRMLGKGERIGLGLSGGKDSLTLLHVLSSLRQSIPFELVALTVDEGIPGYRDRAVENATKRCRDLGIEQHIFSFSEEYGITISEIAEKGKSNLCSYCGVLRRKLLNKRAKELGLDRVAIGHNLDDVAQTAMLNMIRNEPSRFIRTGEADGKGMVQRIRPLQDIREKEVAAYAFLKGHDFSAKCCCPFASNAMRWSVRHQLNFLEDQYPGTKARVASCISTIKESLGKRPEDKISSCSECGAPSATGICMCCRMLGELK